MSTPTFDKNRCPIIISQAITRLAKNDLSKNDEEFLDKLQYTDYGILNEVLDFMQTNCFQEDQDMYDAETLKRYVKDINVFLTLLNTNIQTFLTEYTKSDNKTIDYYATIHSGGRTFKNFCNLILEFWNADFWFTEAIIEEGAPALDDIKKWLITKIIFKIFSLKLNSRKKVSAGEALPTYVGEQDACSVFIAKIKEYLKKRKSTYIGVTDALDFLAKNCTKEKFNSIQSDVQTKKNYNSSNYFYGLFQFIDDLSKNFALLSPNLSSDDEIESFCKITQDFYTNEFWRTSFRTQFTNYRGNYHEIKEQIIFLEIINKFLPSIAYGPRQQNTGGRNSTKENKCKKRFKCKSKKRRHSIKSHRRLRRRTVKRCRL